MGRISEVEWWSLAMAVLQQRKSLKEQAERTKDKDKRRDYLTEERRLASAWKKLEKVM
ncbi:MAG: hypothetical protein AM325_016430 [Candidatus Thorarchaeota archaeon SMTZ1-45]